MNSPNSPDTPNNASLLPMGSTRKQNGWAHYRKRLLILVALMLIVFIMCCAFAFSTVSSIITGSTESISVSNDFMNALIADDYEKAFSQIHPIAGAQFGSSPKGFRQLINDKGIRPTAYTFTKVYVSISHEATIDGIATFQDIRKSVYMYLRKDGSAWKITGFGIRN